MTLNSSLRARVERASTVRKEASALLPCELAAERDVYLAFVRARVGSSADAEDVLQQALVRATARAGDLRDRGRLRAWFFQILRRTIADHHADRALREAKLEMLAVGVRDVAEASPDDGGTCACSLGQLELLRPEYAELLRRVDIEEQPLAVVAQALGVTVNNATVRLHRARKALRERLRAVCGTDSMKACLSCGCE